MATGWNVEIERVIFQVILRFYFQKKFAKKHIPFELVVNLRPIESLIILGAGSHLDTFMHYFNKTIYLKSYLHCIRIRLYIVTNIIRVGPVKQSPTPLLCLGHESLMTIIIIIFTHHYQQQQQMPIFNIFKFMLL